MKILCVLLIDDSRFSLELLFVRAGNASERIGMVYGPETEPLFINVRE